MPNKHPTDTLYANPLAEVSHFRFDDNVASVFPDMIKRSVPGYNTILSMICDMSERYAQSDSHCYDLGCSLGAATLAIHEGITAKNCKIIGIDNSKAMIKRCQIIVDQLKSNADKGASDDRETISTPIELYCNNIESVLIEKASIVVLNFTLQFISMERRQAIIQKIYDGLLPGGILLLSEKVIFTDPPHQQLMTDLYHNFKRTNGYSDLEISQKRTALENVLQPETIDTHKTRLKAAGFNSADVWFQCLTFASLIAIKA